MARNIQFISNLTIPSGTAHAIILTNDDTSLAYVDGKVSVFEVSQILGAKGYLGNNFTYLWLSSSVIILNLSTGVSQTYTLPGANIQLAGIKNNELVFISTISGNRTVQTMNSSGTITVRLTLSSTTAGTPPMITNPYLVVPLNSTADYVSINMDTWTIAFTKTGLPNSSVANVLPDGRFRLAASTTLFYNSTGTNTAPAAVTTQVPGSPTFVNGGSLLFFTASDVTSLNLTTLAITTLTTGRSFTNTNAMGLSGMYSTSSANPGFYDLSTQTFKQSRVEVISTNLDSIPLSYKHTVVLNENLSATSFEVKAFTRQSFNLVRQQTMTGTGGDLLLPENDQYLITVYPSIGTQFKVVTPYNVGDKVYPKNTTQFPYYFTCTTGGTSGLVEPAWNTTVGGTTPTGGAVFTVVEQIPNVAAKFPVLPEPNL